MSSLDYFLNKIDSLQDIYQVTQKVAKLKPSALDKYKGYLKDLDEINERKTLKWIRDAHSQSNNRKSQNFERDVEDIVIEKFNKCMQDPKINQKISQKDISNYGSALKVLIKCYMSVFDGVSTITLKKSIPDKIFAKMIAETAIFVKPEIIEDIISGKGKYQNKQNDYASADNCEHQRAKSGQKVGSKVPGKEPGKDITLDDNTTPNRLLKTAIIQGMEQSSGNWKQFRNYVTCHIWGEPYDNRAFCSLVNLVLIPKAIYGLSDNHELVQKMLQQKSWDLYNHLQNEDEGLKFPFDYITNLSAPTLNNKEKKLYDELKWREFI